MEKWVLVTGDVAKKRCGWVVFDEWDWKKAEYVITFMAQKLQRAAVKGGLLLSGSVEDNIDDWVREKPVKFYSDNDRVECVQPVDRLMVLMNTLKLSSFEGNKILGSYLRANKKDTVILEKLRLIQAGCLTVGEDGAAPKYFVPRQERMRRDGDNAELVQPEDGDQQSVSPVRN
jgi:hypothetical protein